MTVPPVRLVESSKPTDRLAFVDVDDTRRAVRVQWRHGRGEPWTCAACGPMTAPDCEHTFAVAVRLAEDLLGLTRSHQYREEVPA